MVYKIFKDGELINTIVGSESFVESYCNRMGYTYELEEREEPPIEPTPTEPIPLTTDEKVDTLSNSVSDEWESERIYRVDEYCMSNDTLWKCKIQHNGVKPEEGVYWTKVNMASELNYLASLIK